MKTYLPVRIGLFLALICLQQTLIAQINDNCSGAEEIPNVADYCSPFGAGNTFFATQSPVAKPSCVQNNIGRDIWFTFTAVATDMSIVINGSSASAGGSLGGPTVVLYGGDCNQLTELGCAHDMVQADIVELQASGLTPGETYYIRVGGTYPGSFQYCIRSFFPTPPLSGDCPHPVVLCDRNSFNAPAVSGPGDDANELDDAPCLAGFPGESNSSWFVWTAATDGLLTFTLTPNNPGDDLDFVVYRLPNGPGDCTDKVSERCMAAGDFFFPSPCMGPTGLSTTATDFEQPPGCLAGDDNFLAALPMTAGTTYALVVNNFTSSGNGFQLDWAGSTAEFVGPNVGFTDDQPDGKACRGETVTFTDTTSFPGGVLSGWVWNFGKDAVPESDTTQGPHKVQYSTAGAKTVVLTVRTGDGCLVTMTRTLEVDSCCALSATVALEPGCPGAPGATASSTVSNALAPLTLDWSNGQTDTTSIVVGAGSYALIVQDSIGCADTVAFTVDMPLITYTVPNDTLILSGQEINLSAGTSAPTTTVEWTGGNPPTQTGTSITVAPTDTTLYGIKITAGDCIITDSVLVSVLKERFNVPNAFTPNHDNNNDEFYPVSAGAQILEFQVWSRWGKLVHDDPTKGWDGTVNGLDAPADIYVYHVRYRRFGGQEIMQKGDVALLR